MRSLVLIIAVLGTFLCVGCSEATEQEADSSLEERLASTKLPPEQLQHLLQFEEWAFAPGQERFIGLPEVPGLTQSQKEMQLRRSWANAVSMKFGFSVTGNNSYLMPSIRRLANWRGPKLLNVMDAKQASILFLAYQGARIALDEKSKDDLKDLLPEVTEAELLKILVSLDNDRCHIWRQLDGDKVLKTIAFLKLDSEPGEELTPTKRSSVSCIHRAIYFHIGYSNAINLPAQKFVEEWQWKSSLNPSQAPMHILTMNRSAAPRTLPAALLAGPYVGLTKEAALLAYLSELENSNDAN